MIKHGLLLICTLLFSGYLALAQTDTTDDGKLTLTGYIDSYYLTSLKGNPSGNLMGAQDGAGLSPLTTSNGSVLVPAGRAFDRLTNQFALGLVQIKAMYSNKRSDMVIDLTFGPNAELGNFGNQRAMAPGGYATGFYPGNGYQSVLYGSGIAIKQAYWTFKATEKLSFTVGQFGTHIGYEVIDAPINYHYSLSNLFNNGPFYHIGAKANYAFSDKIGLMIGVVNNWDAMTDWKTQKSVIGQLFLKPVEGWNVYLNYIGGFNDDGFKAGADSVAGGRVTNLAYPPFFKGDLGRHLFDITTGYQINDRVNLGVNAAWGFYYSSDSSFKTYAKTLTKERSTREKEILPWGGFAVYGSYKFNDVIGLGARFEHFSDVYQVRYLGTMNNSITITAPITLASGHLIIKPEWRLDTSPNQFGFTAGGKPQYYYETRDIDSDGAMKTSKQQSTIGCAFIYKY